MSERDPNRDLFQAVVAGDLSAMRTALVSGASIHAVRVGTLDTPLHLAAERSHQLVAAMLIEAGADPNAQNLDGRTPLHEAAFRPTPAVWDRLIDAGADDQLPARDGMTPAMIRDALAFGPSIVEYSQEQVSLLNHERGLTRSR